MEASLWSRCARALENELPEQQFNTWVRPLQSIESEGELHLLAPNRFVVDWVRSNLLARIRTLMLDSGLTVPPAITVEVGSGIRSPEDAAALYDQDVEKQAKQLGLPNW